MSRGVAMAFVTSCLRNMVTNDNSKCFPINMGQAQF